MSIYKYIYNRYKRKNIKIKTIKPEVFKLLKYANINVNDVKLAYPTYSKPSKKLKTFVDNMYVRLYNDYIKAGKINGEYLNTMANLEFPTSFELAKFFRSISTFTHIDNMLYTGLLCDYHIDEFKYLLDKLGINDEIFNTYYNVLNAGVAYISFDNNTCILTELPYKHNNIDRNHREFHDSKKPILRIMDEKWYYIQGLRIKTSIYDEIKNRTMNIQDILTIENTDLRSAYLFLYDVEYLLSELQAETIDIYQPQMIKSEYISDDIWKLLDYGEVTLYKVPKDVIHTSEDGLFIKYKDPSTARMYIDGVPTVGSIPIEDSYETEDIEIKTAYQAMLWKSNLSKKEFDNILVAT